MRKIIITEEELDEFVETAMKVQDGNFYYKYDDSENAVFVKNLDLSVDENYKSLPEYTGAKDEVSFKKARKLILDRLVLQAIINSSVPTQGVKDKAQARLTIVNQELLAIFA